MELNIKREPSVEFELNLPPREDNPFGIKNFSVNLLRFDEKWNTTTSIFARFDACRHCNFISRQARDVIAREKENHQVDLKCGQDQCIYVGKSKQLLRDHQMRLGHGAYAGSTATFDCNQCK